MAAAPTLSPAQARQPGSPAQARQPGSPARERQPDPTAGGAALLAGTPRDGAPIVDVVVPVLDEEGVLEASIRRLHDHLGREFPFSWRITIADNGSTDATPQIADRLAATLPDVAVSHIDRRGRGRALRATWLHSDAVVLAYTDVDLSTDLDALLPLVAPLLSGHSDIAIGSRLSQGSSVARGPRREVISRAYNLILRTAFSTGFHDAQCGFKAVRADVARALLPEVHDDGWFFDTELLLLAEHHGLRIHEVPVDWVDDPDSRVDVARTALDDLRGVVRMLRRFATGTPELGYRRAGVRDDMGRSLVTFAMIGLLSTLVSLATFLVLREPIGAVAANAFALTVTAGANTWANRRYTLGRTGARGRSRHYALAAALWAATLAVSTAVLLALGPATTAVQVVALVLVWTLAALTRFTMLAASRRRTT